MRAGAVLRRGRLPAGEVTTRLDHLVVGAGELDAGAAAFACATGLDLPPGGAHPRMGTRNHLARLDAGAYLEIIAVDPALPAPPHPRWYGLDDAATRAALVDGPRLLAWVVAVDDLDTVLGTARAAGVDAGRALEQERDGLRWRIGVREDGRVPEGGAFPVPIEWPGGESPAARMADLGLALGSLRVTHPEPARLGAALAAIGADGLVTVREGEPGLAATLVRGDERIAL